MTPILDAKIREKNASRKDLKKDGLIPAICYGNNIDSMSIAVPAVQFKKIWKEGGETSTVTINTGDKKVETLIHEIQRDATTNEPIHVDFLAIDTSKKVSVNVPIEFDGISEAVKTGVGTLIKVLHEVEIEALPKDLPHALHADLALLKTGDDRITVADLAVPAGVAIITPASEIVATIEREREETTEAPVADISSIEVEKKGKKEEEAEA